MLQELIPERLDEVQVKVGESWVDQSVCVCVYVQGAGAGAGLGCV